MASAASRWGRSCRTRLCGWCSQLLWKHLRCGHLVSMPHAALWVVQPCRRIRIFRVWRVSMPHAALWVVQPSRKCGNCERREVSMPHAALWVVQRYFSLITRRRLDGFNAARGFVGGATTNSIAKRHPYGCFNAARGFVGGATVHREVPLPPSYRFQCRTRLCGWCNYHSEKWYRSSRKVSMPHAALWVVQRTRSSRQ